MMEINHSLSLRSKLLTYTKPLLIKMVLATVVVGQYEMGLLRNGRIYPFFVISRKIIIIQHFSIRY